MTTVAERSTQESSTQESSTQESNTQESSTQESSTSIAERVLALSGIVGSIVLVGIISYELGHANGRDAANRSMWETPPGMASCVVYPDGGKRCMEASRPEPKPLIECLRMCKAQDRMARVRPG
jgi:hypothetical protein